MESENNKKKKTSLGTKILIVVVGVPLLVIILAFIVALSPVIVIGFIFYQWFNYLNDCNRRKANLKLKLENRIVIKN